MIPQRWQRSRKAGSRQPPRTRYCGRGTVWGNPFEIGYREYGGHTCFYSRESVVNLYAQELSIIAANLKMTENEFLRPLLDYDYLSCFCSLDLVCHVDVIIARLKILVSPPVHQYALFL